ncbi:MAG: stage III sporulation AC/AD family protein [Clostridia bacterium]|nr:stage III sporulation AC/AD family protein [Clostridia bacterium]
MSLWQVAGLACASCFMALVLKHWREEFSFPITLAASLALLSFALTLMKPLLDFLLSVMESHASLLWLLIPTQASCAALVAHFSAEICRENGYPVLAFSVEFAAKAMILTIMLPLVKQLFQLMIRWGS